MHPYFLKPVSNCILKLLIPHKRPFSKRIGARADGTNGSVPLHEVQKSFHRLRGKFDVSVGRQDKAVRVLHCKAKQTSKC